MLNTCNFISRLSDYMGRRETTRIGRRQAARKGLPYVPLHKPGHTTENDHDGERDDD